MSISKPSKPVKLHLTQQMLAALIMNPLTPRWKTNSKLKDRRSTRKIAGQLIKPNNRLSSLERLEIYNRQYWFRLLDILYDDFPGVRAVLGEDKFLRLRVEYLSRFPSTSYALRDLGAQLPRFIEQNSKWGGKRRRLLVDMVRFEWAQIEAFDAPALPRLDPKKIAGADPKKLKLKLQPHLSLLKLSYPLDEFAIALRQESKQASEASSQKQSPRMKTRKLKLPLFREVFLTVHRVDGSLYYKRLDEPAFKLLNALRSGKPLAQACQLALRSFSKEEHRSGHELKSIESWFANFSALSWFCIPGRE